MTLDCGAKEQTAEHLITSSPIYNNPNGTNAFLNTDKSLMNLATENLPSFNGPSSFLPSFLTKKKELKYDVDFTEPQT